MLREEHPQTIAMVLVHLGPARAAAVLASLDAQRQVDIARRIAAMNRIDPAVLGEAENALCERLRESSAQTAGGIEGVSTVARILHHAGYATEKAVLEGLSGDEPSLADSIRRRMFEYEDIVLLPAHRLRAALERVDVEELAVSLRTAGESFREKLFSAVPARTARRIREEMDRIGPVRLSDVEAAQQHVVEVVRQSETGEYISAGKVPRGEVLA
jgi:flagellar motor switch protein FliG